MFRFLLKAALVYLGYRGVKSVWESRRRSPEIKGKAESKPLDLSRSDVSEARFEDVENDPS